MLIVAVTLKQKGAHLQDKFHRLFLFRRDLLSLILLDLIKNSNINIVLVFLYPGPLRLLSHESLKNSRTLITLDLAETLINGRKLRTNVYQLITTVLLSLSTSHEMYSVNFESEYK